MKKLLALVLCVVMLASISVSAFAAVDLSPAYTARTNLYNAYGDLAGAVAFANATIGIRTLLDDPTWNGLNAADFLQGAVSYEGLFALVGPAIYGAYETAGNTFVGDLATDINTAAAAVDLVALAIVAGI